jgi:hypothetical protein
MNRKHTIVLGLVLVLVVAPGLGVVGAVGSGAVQLADQEEPDGGLETAAQPIADTHPVVKEAIEDWADDQRLTDATRKKLRKAAGKEFDREQLRLGAAKVTREYPDYDLPLLLMLYGSDEATVDVLIEYDSSATAAQARSVVTSADSGATVEYTFEDLNLVAVEDLDKDAVAAIGSNARVEKVKLDRAVFLPETVESSSQHGDTTDWDVERVGAKALWDQGYQGSGVRVAVLDSGIDDEHPDLDQTLDGEDKVVDERVFVETTYTQDPANDGDGHGTHVAGILAGTGDASNGDVMGVAPNAKLLNIKVFNNDRQDNAETLSDIIAAVEYAVDQDADVISMSLGTNAETPNGESDLSEAVDDAVEQGVFVSVASGNDGERSIWYYFR